MKTIATLLVAAAVLVGCASSGHRFEMADVNTFQPGVTTYNDAVAKLGQPHSESYNEDGTKAVIWAYSFASPVGAFARATKILFDKDGKLVRVMSRVQQ